MKLLLTGFTPFGKLKVNPSQVIVQEIKERAASLGQLEIISAVLPTEFAAAGEKIQALIRENQPEAVLMLGVSTRLETINLERVALNLDDASMPDNAGETPNGQLIFPEAPKAYWSTFPLDEMKSALQESDIPVQISNHAGAYVCNHVFFVARHTLETLEKTTPCGFVHIPLIRGQEGAPEDLPPGLPQETIIAAVEGCIRVLQGVVAAGNGS
jgi:pyroglutamyl-peptidase